MLFWFVTLLKETIVKNLQTKRETINEERKTTNTKQQIKK